MGIIIDDHASAKSCFNNIIKSSVWMFVIHGWYSRYCGYLVLTTLLLSTSMILWQFWMAWHSSSDLDGLIWWSLPRHVAAFLGLFERTFTIAEPTVYWLYFALLLILKQFAFSARCVKCYSVGDHLRCRQSYCNYYLSIVFKTLRFWWLSHITVQLLIQ